MLKSNKPNTKVRVLWGSNEFCTTVTIPTLSCVHFKVINNTVMQKERKGQRKSKHTLCPHYKRKELWSECNKTKESTWALLCLETQHFRLSRYKQNLKCRSWDQHGSGPREHIPTQVDSDGQSVGVGLLSGQEMLSYIWRGQHWREHFSRRKKTQSPGHTLPLCAAVIFFLLQQTAFWISEHQ